MKIKINKHLFQKIPMHTSYRDDDSNETDHSIWWLWFIITWTEKKKQCGCSEKGCC